MDAGLLMKVVAPKRFALLLSGLLGLCNGAQADEAPLILDPSVVTGSRRARPPPC